MSIKILQVTAAYKPAYIYGGPTMSVAKLCEALSEKSANEDNIFDLEAFTTTANGKTELENVKPNDSTIVDGVKVTYFERLTRDHTHFSPALLLALKQKINEQGLDKNNSLIIHIHAWWNLVSIFSCAIAKWYNVPVVLSPRGMLTAYTSTNRNSLAKTIIHQIAGKRLLKYCHIHATSEQEKTDILSIFTPKSITIIPNLVELSGATPALLCDKQQIEHKPKLFKLIYLSRIEEKKGLELLFEALSKLSFTWHLTIAGSGEEGYVDTLKLKVKNLNLDNNINWVGQVKNENKFNLLAEHDLMILTSYNENFANVVIESLSVGTPVLLSSHVGLANYVEFNQLGWITDLNIDTITHNIQQAYEDESKRIQIRGNAPQLISDDYNPKKLILKYQDLYRSF